MSGPDLIIVGAWQHLQMRKEWAALDAKKEFAGRNWRRIKREMNRARKRIHG